MPHLTQISFSDRFPFIFQLGEELWFTVGGQHIPFGASPQVLQTIAFKYMLTEFVLEFVSYLDCLFGKLMVLVFKGGGVMVST